MASTLKSTTAAAAAANLGLGLGIGALEIMVWPTNPAVEDARRRTGRLRAAAVRYVTGQCAHY